MALILLVGVIPLLFGFLLEVVVLMPVKVPVNQSPVYFLWQDWALGAMYTKISIALTFMGPDWWMKAAIEQLYEDGLRRINLSFLIPRLVIPVVTALGLALAVPYVMSHSLIPMLISDTETIVLIQRRIYPCLLIVWVTLGLVVCQFKQFHKLYEHIKNDRCAGRREKNTTIETKYYEQQQNPTFYVYIAENGKMEVVICKPKRAFSLTKTWVGILILSKANKAHL